ncbi:MAG: RNA polymerase sigma factor, partial [Chloroflexi bacterium]
MRSRNARAFSRGQPHDAVRARPEIFGVGRTAEFIARGRNGGAPPQPGEQSAAASALTRAMTPLSTDEQDARDMARLAGGHDAALNELMERHSQKVFYYLLRSLQNEDDAADLAQETFVRVYQNRARFDSGQKFTTWLYAIASNLVRDRFRWRSRHPQVSLDVENQGTEVALKETLADRRAAPDQALQVNERAEAVRQAVARLPPELREPLILAVYQGLSQAEIGKILKCS